MKFKNLLPIIVLMLCFSSVYGIKSDTTEPALFLIKYPAIYSHDCPMDSYTERVTCGINKLMTELYYNIMYPETTKINGVEGVVVISFVIEKDSALSNFKIIRNPDAGLGEEALRALQELKYKWEPDINEGEVVRSQLRVPVRFSLTSQPKKKRKRKKKN